MIEAARVPIHEDAATLAARDGRPPLEHALHDGEDHELLFAASREPGISGITRIGAILANEGVWLDRNGQLEELPERGWRHTL